MKVLGLITEYNPFHNGHLYHIQKSKEITNADYTIVIMSSNYVQRGKPAIIDKWKRTKMALEAGVDMVIELPCIYSTSSAEFFAYGSVKLCDASGIIDTICFGSELADMQLFVAIADVLIKEPLQYKIVLKNELDKGLGFAKARANALFHYMTHYKSDLDQDNLLTVLSSPNNILGIEYIKSLKKLNSNIIPKTLKREQAQYHDQYVKGKIASATSIRRAILEKKFDAVKLSVPKHVYEILVDSIEKGLTPVTYNDYSQVINYILSTYSNDKLKNFMEISEGLDNRIKNQTLEGYTVNKLIHNLNTKRYTNTRLSRSLIHLLLDINKNDFLKYHYAGGPQYIRVLGFRKKSDILFSMLKKNSQLPIVTNVGKAEKQLSGLAKKMLQKEISATDIYYLGIPNKDLYKKGYEYTKQLVII